MIEIYVIVDDVILVVWSAYKVGGSLVITQLLHKCRSLFILLQKVALYNLTLQVIKSLLYNALIILFIIN